MTRFERALVAVGLATILVAGIVPLRAEIGVHTHTTVEPSGPYIILQMTEDPDPYLGFWTDYASSSDPNRIVLNPDGDANGDGRPSAVRNTVSDTPIVAWSRNSPGGYDVVVSRFTDAVWSEPEVVAGSSDDELDPWLTIDPSDGTVHLVYWVDSPIPTVMHRQAPADLSSWSPALPVSDGIEPSYRPGAVVHGGVLKVIYELHVLGPGQTPRQIVVAQKDGPTFTSQVMDLSNHDGDLWPQIHSHSGRLWLEWIDSDDEMAWMELETGGWSVPQYEGFATLEELECHVRGAIRAKAIAAQD